MRYSSSPRLTSPTGLHVYCDLKVNGDVKATGATVVGDSANATQESGITVETAVEQSAPFNVTVDCNQNSPSTPAVVLNRPQIMALQVVNVVTTP
ncbi:MAG: hypothetical protein H0W96_03070 [Solirubrobacterales bacterium]|nr:hypothetical protein [Solirubrobacterales bacterium]